MEKNYLETAAAKRGKPKKIAEMPGRHRRVKVNVCGEFPLMTGAPKEFYYKSDQCR